MKKLKQSKYTQQDKTPENGQNLGMVKIRSENKGERHAHVVLKNILEGLRIVCVKQLHHGEIAYHLHIIYIWQLHHGGIAHI